MKGFTLRDNELLRAEGVGGDPTPFEIGDILVDPSVVKGFNLGDTELLGVEGLQDWLSEVLGDIEGDP